MNLFYAVGGGLGHITRTITFIQNLSVDIRQSILLTNSTYANTPFIPKGLTVIHLQEEHTREPLGYHKFLISILQTYQITDVYLDAFPCGILGEWNDFIRYKKLHFHYIARILKWDTYSAHQLKKPPFFQKSYVVEPLGNAQQHFISQNSSKVIPLQLKYAIPSLTQTLQNDLQTLKKNHRQIWLICHSEPSSELRELYEYAYQTSKIQGSKVQFLILSQSTFNTEYTNIYFRDDIYPVTQLFPWVDKIITACGFNIIQQTKTHRDKHLFIPFIRKYDDQFLRAKLVRAGQL